jgi:hypothetical protein
MEPKELRRKTRFGAKNIYNQMQTPKNKTNIISGL